MRKKKYDPENRNHVIHVRLNDNEYDQFQLQVDRAEMTMSDYIREMVLTGTVNVTVKPVMNSKQLDKIAYECGRIGNNINQIAKHLNEGNPVTARVLKNINHELADLQLIREKIEQLAEGK